MVTPLDQLLLGINPRSGQADHFINIARSVVTHTHTLSLYLSLAHSLSLSRAHTSYMSLSWETPELALSAINILILACNSHKAAKEMAVAIGNNKVYIYTKHEILSFSSFLCVKKFPGCHVFNC